MLKILHLEDLSSDAELVSRALKRENIACQIMVVDKKDDFINALDTFNPDIILSDHSLPAFNSREALTLANSKNKNIPFILVTATVSEEYAVSVMKDGADDYILKDRLQRLPSAVLNSLEKYRLENERLQFIDQIIASEGMLKEAERLSRIGSLEIDIDKGQNVWSDELYRILGYQPFEVAPTIENFLAKVHPDDTKRVRNEITKAVLTATPIETEFRLLLNNNSCRYISAALDIKDKSDSKAQRLSGFIQDVTNRKNAELNLAALNNSLEKKVQERTTALEALNNELNSFCYSISHDLRSPLRLTDSFASLLSSKCSNALDNDGKLFLSEIRKSIKHMNQQIDDLLRFSQLGRAELKTEFVRMDDIVSKIVQSLKLSDETIKAEVQINNLLPSVCDPRLIEHVWTNIISNAFKYSGKKEVPLIEIGSNEIDNTVVYYVKDNGAGFDISQSQKLFGVFQRLHAESEFSGTGVGLAISYRIVTRHGGKIWADAQPDKGATFYFSLPKTS